MKLTPAQKEVLQGARVLPDGAGTLAGPMPEELQAELLALGLGKMDGRAPEHLWLIGRGLWPVWAIEHFPASAEEVHEWTPHHWTHALAQHVLAVAHTRTEGAWAAYINAVPGWCHADEAAAVLAHGEKLGQDVAEALFPHLKELPYAR